MARTYTNTECPLHGTKYCETLNMLSCDTCTVRGRKDEELEDAKAELDVLETLMPEDGIEDLFHTEECRFCKGEEKGKRTCFAQADLGHTEPKRKRNILFGLKIKLRVGSLIPLQIACCDKCKKRINLLEYITPVMTTLFTVIAILLLMVRPFRESLAAVFELLPIGVFIGGIAIGYIAGVILRNALIKKYSVDTCLDIYEIPKIARMHEAGWFQISEYKKVSRVVFTNKPLRQGIYTAIHKKSTPAE